MTNTIKEILCGYSITGSDGIFICRKEQDWSTINIVIYHYENKITHISILIMNELVDSFSLTIKIPEDNTLSNKILIQKAKNFAELYAYEKFIAARAYLLGHNINLAPSLF